MSKPLPVPLPNIETWLIQEIDGPALMVRNVKPQLPEPYRLVVIRADLQNSVTPLSRYCRINVQGWSVRSDGSADLIDAFAVATEFARAVEARIGQGPLLSAEVDAGPYRVPSTAGELEFANLSILAEVTSAI